MGKRLVVASHAGVSELERGYRAQKEVVSARQWQVIWLLAQGHTSEQVAKTTGLSLEWVRVLVRRYNAGGTEALGDGRHNNPGVVPRVTQVMEEALSAALEQEAPARVGGGVWSGPKVVQFFEQQFAVTLSVRRAQEIMQRVGYSCRKPPPLHAKADLQDQEAFKKSSKSR